MVLVDTSVWIDLFRQRATTLGEVLYRLVVADECAICGQIYVEFIGGFKNAEQRKKQAKNFALYPITPTTEKDFLLAAELLARHPQLGPGDTIIAAIAINTKSQLLTLDKDFLRLEKEGLKLFIPRQA